MNIIAILVKMLISLLGPCIYEVRMIGGEGVKNFDPKLWMVEDGGCGGVGRGFLVGKWTSILNSCIQEREIFICTL